MKTRTLIVTVASLAAGILLSACSSGKSGNGGGNTTTAQSCPAGTVFISQYNGCFSTAQCPVPPNSGYVPQVNQCIAGTPGGVVPTNVSHGWTGDIILTNGNQYGQMLKDTGICYWDCSYWDDFGSFQLEIKGDSIPANGAQTWAVIHAVSQSMLRSDVVFKGFAVVADNNTTIQMQTTGPMYAYNKFFKIIVRPSVQPVPATNIKSIPQARVELYYNGVMFGYTDVLLRW